MKFVLTGFAILSCLLAASLAADDNCKFANFPKDQTLVTGEQQAIEWTCKGNAKDDLVYLEFGTGKTPDDYVYVDTIDAKAKASAKKFSFILKDEYPSGEYIARMLTIGAKEQLPVEEAERAELPWTYSPAFEIQNNGSNTTDDDDDSKKNSTDDNADDDDDDSSSRRNPNSNTTSTSNNPNTADEGDSGNPLNAADVISIAGSPVLFCAGVLAIFFAL